MRDDIHRNAPAPPAYKRLIKECGNVDWQDGALRQGFKVLRKEVQMLSPKLIRDVSKIDHHQGSLFLEDSIRRLLSRKDLSESDQVFLGYVKLEYVDPGRLDPLRAAMYGYLTEQTGARCRDIDCYLLKENISDRRELMRRVRKSVCEEAISQVASQVASGEDVSLPAKAPPIDIEVGS